jgi:hypothetical protein
MKFVVDFDFGNMVGDTDSASATFEFGDDWCAMAALIEALQRARRRLVEQWGPDVMVTDLSVSVLVCKEEKA